MVEIGIVKPGAVEKMEITVYHQNKMNTNSVLAKASFPVRRLIEVWPSNGRVASVDWCES